MLMLADSDAAGQQARPADEELTVPEYTSEVSDSDSAFGDAAPTASEAARVEVSNKDLLSACLGFVSASQRGATP